MEFKQGQIVKSIAGHDKGDFQTVLAVELPFLILCDGKRRSLEKPKRKKAMHVRPTGTRLTEEQLRTNRKIRSALHAFRTAKKQGTEETEDCKT